MTGWGQDCPRASTILIESLIGSCLSGSRAGRGLQDPPQGLGAAAPEQELWSLDDLVRDAVDSLGARDRVEIVGEAPLVNVDAGQIQRVLANLVENALKFSPPDASVLVRITATRKEAIVRVVDQGPGLPESELERVFEPFYRRDAARGGAGLGLAIARGFAAANGGRIWAESRPAQGATFGLALPVVEVPAELAT